MEVHTEDGTLHTAVFGSGPRNFLAHGAGPAGWEVWQLPIERLSALGWRAASYDHRGSGSSVFDEEKITATALVDDVFRVMDALGFERCVLAGESMGCVVTMLAVQKHPERFDGLVLCTPPRAISAQGRPLWEGWETDLEGFSRWFVDACMPEPDSQHLKTWAFDIFAKGSARKGYAAMRCLFEAGASAIPDLQRITVPTVVLTGDADLFTPEEMTKQVIDGIPNAVHVSLQGVGHAPTVTRPDDIVEAITTRF